jgi:hypothetical protein
MAVKSFFYIFGLIFHADLRIIHKDKDSNLLTKYISWQTSTQAQLQF